MAALSSRLNSARRQCARRTASHVESLEPRMLLSAELGLGLDVPRDAAHDTALLHPALDPFVLTDWLPDTATPHHAPLPAPLDLTALASLESGDRTTHQRQELIFIDAGIAEFEQLRSDLDQRHDGVLRTIVVLDSGAEGLQQIDALLGRSRDVDAVHIFAHGSRAGLQLGSTWLNAASLAEHADTVAGWQQAFSAQGDLLLYGCDLAASDAGRSLVQSLAKLTGADVVASDDLTGSAALGGDWMLEYATGVVDTNVAMDDASPTRWSGVLGQISVTTINDVLDGDANTTSLAALALTPGADGFVSLREAIKAANSSAGADTINLQAGTYSLTRFGLDDTTGDLDIRDSLTIVGASPGTTTVDGSNLYRIFEVHDDAAITVKISNLKIQNGLANLLSGEDGGGVFVQGSSNTPNVYLSNVWFSANATSGITDEGGAIYNAGHLDIDGALIEGNHSKKGGGIFNASGGVLNMSNVTLSGNQATVGQGGGFHNAGTATLNHITVTANSASTQGGGVFDSGTLYLSNAILSGNSAGSSGSDLSGALNGSDSNIFGNDSGGSGYDASDRRNVNPNLGALTDNGGSLKTYAPQAGSQAIGNADVGNTVSLDQRGFLRNDGSPDIGAHEVGASSIAIGHYLDRFSSIAYSGNDGTLAWSNDWQEIGEGNGAGSGSIGIRLELGEQALQIHSNGGGVWRQANLSGASQAFLSFDYVRENLGVGENLVVEASTDGGSSWTQIGSVNGPADDSFFRSANFNLSAHIDNDTRVRFVAGGGHKVFLDNVRIDLGSAPLNHQLAATNLTQIRSYTEGAATIALNDIVITDVDSGEIVTATLTLVDINAGVLTTSGTATYTPATGVWTVTGTVANVNAALAAVSFTPVTNYDRDTSITLAIADGGENGTVAVTGTITLDVTPVNDQLSASNLIQTRTYTEDAVSVAINDIVVSDVDTAETVTATLTLADVNAGVLTISGTATYTPAIGVWTITDTVTNVNAALAAISFTPATNYDLDTTISVNIADGSENGTVAVTGTITLDVTPVNDQLSATNLVQTRTYTEGAASVAINDIVISDVDTAETVTVTLTLADINAGVLTTSGTATYTSATGVWTITNTIANVNAALAAVSFTPATNYDQDTSIAVAITDGGENGTVPATGTITLDVTPVNDQLSATNLTQTRAYTENAASVAINDIVITDADSAESVTATLTLADINGGVLTTSGTATYTPATGVWTMTGTVTDVNAALAAVSFVPVANYNLDTTISVNIIDGGENGAVPVTGTITLDVDPAPVNAQISATNLTHTRFYTESDASVAINSIVVSDDDGAETVTATLTLADINAGVLSTSGAATYTPATGVWTITGTIIDVNAALAALSFAPATNYDLDTTISVTIADGGENGTVPLTGTITLDVTPVNDQLSASDLTQVRTYTEGAASVAIDDIVITDVDNVETVTATLTLADIDAGVLTTSGTATYTAATGVWTITDTVLNVNAALAAVSFTPATDYDLDTSIAVTIADGGENGTVAATGTIVLDVTSLNDQLSATNLTQTRNFTEGAASVAVNDIVITDVDSAETVTATLTLADINAGVLTTSGTATYTGATGVWTITDTVANVNAALAALSFSPTTNFDLNTTVAVTIADGGENGSAAVTGTISLNVTPINAQLSATELTQTRVYTEGAASVAINDIVITDVDSAEIVTATLTLADINAGELTTSGTATYTPATGIWTVTGTVTSVNAALASVNFMPATDYDLNTTIAVTIADGGENGTVAMTGTITLEVTAVNDQLSASNLNQSLSFIEDGGTVSLGNMVISDADTGELVTATLTLADMGAGTLSTSGGATFSMPGGVWTISGTIADVNAALAAVSFTPAVNYAQHTSIAISIADGGENGTVTATGIINLTAIPVDDTVPVPDIIPAPGAASGATDDVQLTRAVIADFEAARSMVQESATATLSRDYPAVDTETNVSNTVNSAGPPFNDATTGGMVSTISAGPLATADNLANDDAAQIREVEPAADESTAAALDDDRPVTKSQTGIERVLRVIAEARSLGASMVKSITTHHVDSEIDADRADGRAVSATLNSPQFRDELDHVRKDMNAVDAMQGTIVNSTVVASSGFTIGYVAWLTRGGLLLASMLSSMPAWRSVDPLPILASLKQREPEDGDDDSLATLLDDQAPTQSDEAQTEPAVPVDGSVTVGYVDEHEAGASVE